METGEAGMVAEGQQPLRTIQEPAKDTLQSQVDTLRSQIRTDNYSMSVGELASLYEDDEMIINPKFQRFFRWTDEQKTAFVESVLLGIPLPSIFVSADRNGVWQVVDGLQRLSTLFQAMGKLRTARDKSSLRFTKARYLTELKGREWSDLPKALQLDFRRAKINISIILRGEDERAQYDLFERLNTGGTSLSEQEVRNCLLVMKNEEFFDWFVELSKDFRFQECISINERSESESYDQELASRFLIFSDIEAEKLKGIGDLGPFVNNKMLEMAGEDQTLLERREKIFEDTFGILGSPEIGDSAFKQYDTVKGQFKGRFLISAFEAIACGIAYHLSQGASVSDFSADTVMKKILDIWGDTSFSNTIKAGRTSSVRIPKTIDYGRKIFDPKK